VTVFGTTVSWHDFGELLQEGKWLDKSIKAGSVKPALLYRLMKYHEMEKSIDKPISNALWRSHFFYDVTRNIEDTEIRNKVKEFVNTHIKNLRLPISYAIYMNRKEGKR
jgi:hypothetical protein